MLPRILCHSAGIIRSTRQRQHKILLFAGIGRPQARCLQPGLTPLVPTFRNLSTNKNDSSSDGTSAEKAIAKDTNVKEEPSIVASGSSTAPSVDASNHKIQQPDPQKPPSSPSMDSSIPSTQTSSSPTATTPASTSASTVATNNNPKESATDAISLTPSTGESPMPLVPPKKSDATDGGSTGTPLADYYDRVFRLWSERSGTSEILGLKESVNDAGAAFDTASATVTTNRRNLDDALRKWERASGQHMHLLQRRESWTPDDAQRFADFVSLEITSRGELDLARHDLGRSEELLTRSQLDYINKMRRRYHEEQIWQDQWRVLGTYGTWTLIFLNSCVFMGSQFFQIRRERGRIETIERLIRENNNSERIIQIEEQKVEVDHETSEMPASAMAMAIENNADNNNDVIRTESEDENTAKNEEELLKSVDPSEFGQKDTANPEGDDEPNYPLHPTMERIGTAVASVGSFVNRWEHRVRCRAKELAGSANQKLYQALPANIAKEIPKSVSDIHVPSAVIGASVGGIAALTVSVIFSALFSNRRY